MASVVSINNLSDWLQSQPENTADNPYEITITDLTTSNHTEIKTALIENINKFVDLRTTSLPNGITDLGSEFEDCSTLVYSPVLPSSARFMWSAFVNCKSLKIPPAIPANIYSINNAFRNCWSLTEAPVLPNEIPSSSLDSTFYECRSLRLPPSIPSNIVSLNGTFFGCSSLIKAPVIPNSVRQMDSTFKYCDLLEEVPIIPSSVNTAKEAFYNCYALKKIDEFNIPIETLKNNSSFRGMFSACRSLETIGFPIQKSEAWHIFRVKVKTDSIEGKVFDKNGDYETISSTSITKTDIVFPNLSDELLFSSTISDSDLDDLIKDVIDYKYTYFGDSTRILNPKNRSFVFWADDVNNVVTNLSFPADVSHASGVLPVANGGTGRTTAPNIRVNLASTSSVSELPASGDVTPGVTGTLPVANGGTGRTTTANGAWYTTAANQTSPTIGTLPVAQGGTGQTTQANTNKAIIGAMDTGSSDVTDGTEFVSSYASDNGFSDSNAPNVPYKRSFLKVWNYIKGKISSVLGLTDTSYGGTAASANTVDGYHADVSSGSNLIRVTKGSDVGNGANGYYAGMTQFNVDGATKWWHILSMDWSGNDATNWQSQFLLPTQQGGVPKYRRNTAGGTAIASSTWHNFITDENNETMPGIYTGSGGQQNPQYVGKGRVRFNMMNTTINGDSTYKNFLLMDCYTGFDVGGATAIGISRTQNKAFIMSSDAGTSPNRPTTWARTAEIITTANIGSQTVNNSWNLSGIEVVVPPAGETSYNYTTPHWSNVVKAKLTTTGGYIIFSNGFRILWGLHTNTGGDTAQTINFNSAVGATFTQPPIVNVDYRRGDSQSVFYYALNISEISASSFKIGSHSSFNNNLKYCWVAIGY